MAWESARCLNSQGWTPRIVLDYNEHEYYDWQYLYADYAQPGKGMYGTKCAKAIADIILGFSSTGDIVAKFDCDIRMSDEISEWMKSATTKARSVPLANRHWGGFWSCPREQLEKVAEYLETVKPCGCAESNIFLDAFALCGGQDFHPTQISAGWLPDRTMAENVGVVTLPSKCDPFDRLECGLAIFQKSFLTPDKPQENESHDHLRP